MFDLDFSFGTEAKLTLRLRLTILVGTSDSELVKDDRPLSSSAYNFWVGQNV